MKQLPGGKKNKKKRKGKMPDSPQVASVQTISIWLHSISKQTGKLNLIWEIRTREDF